MLEQILEFNPHFRATAHTLLKSKLFDFFRRPELQQMPPFKIDLEIDREGAFDYDNGSSTMYDESYYYKIL